jgi:hypothetical protein
MDGGSFLFRPVMSPLQVLSSLDLCRQADGDSHEREQISGASLRKHRRPTEFVSAADD